MDSKSAINKMGCMVMLKRLCDVWVSMHSGRGPVNECGFYYENCGSRPNFSRWQLRRWSALSFPRGSSQALLFRAFLPTWLLLGSRRDLKKSIENCTTSAGLWTITSYDNSSKSSWKPSGNFGLSHIGIFSFQSARICGDPCRHVNGLISINLSHVIHWRFVLIHLAK